MPLLRADSFAFRVFMAALVISIAVLGFAYYLQHVVLLDPCPWCVAQRILFMLLAVLSLLALLHGRGTKLYAALAALIALAGGGAAVYQLWLQQDPVRSMACSGTWLEKTLDTLSFGKLWPNMLQYDGPCTISPWSFLGMSIPEWSLVWFAVLAAAFTSLLFRRA